MGRARPLHDRERRVLRLASEGMASAASASTLGLSEGTARNYLSDAISKLGAPNLGGGGTDRAEKGMALA